jgi:nucleoside phosphorylase
MPPLPIEEYQVGWICALPEEMAAARAMLDEEHGAMPSQDAHDHNNYVLGHVHNHNVVIACLPAGVDGTNAAATIATNMLRTFKGVRFGLMVGIGGGIPNLDKGVDIRLGDVVVSQPDKTYGGVVQYDKGKSLEGGQFERKGSLNKPPSLLLNALASLQAQYEVHGSQMSTYLHRMIEQHPNMEENGYTSPGVEHDCLYCAHCQPTSNTQCDKCQDGKLRRKQRRSTKPVVHYGIIASGNQVVKDSVVRDRLGKEFEAKCVEMEAAGLMDDFPCLVIRGVCDYVDAYKNDVWHRYAATTAAAYAKEFLSIVPQQAVSQISCVSDVMSKCK